jgi:glutathione S-transferase
VLLIGIYDSPYVRRVAVSLKLCGIAFEHGNWSVGADFEHIRQYNPLVRVPTLFCAFTFLTEALNLGTHAAPYPALRALAARCEELPEFQSTRAEFNVPQSA